jgi:hypothetical protein
MPALEGLHFAHRRSGVEREQRITVARDGRAEAVELRRQLDAALRELDDLRSRGVVVRSAGRDSTIASAVDGMAEGLAAHSSIRDELGRIVDFQVDYVNDTVSLTLCSGGPREPRSECCAAIPPPIG